MANRYWVGGTGTWDGTAGTKWAATSGGAGGVSVPTTADDVFFTSASGGTCTISAGNTGAKSIDCSTFNGTIAGTAAITVAGSVGNMGPTALWDHTGIVTITGTGTIGFTSNRPFSTVVIDGVGITVTQGAALNTSGRTITVTNGTFDTANYTLSTGAILSTNTNNRTINLGSSTVTLFNNPALDFTTPTNLTFNAGTSQINMNLASAQLRGGSRTFYNVNFTSTAVGTRSITGANTFNNLTLTASATGLSQLTLAANQTVNGTLTCAGLASRLRGFVRSDTMGTSRTITANAVSATDCDFRDITIAGAASPISPTRAGDCGGNSGITFPSAKTVYRVGTDTVWSGSSSWALSSNGTGSDNNIPLAQDTAIIDNATTLSGTLELALSFNIGTLDASTRTTGITLNHNATANRYGSYILGSGVTVSGTSAQTFSGRSTQTFTSAGKTITFPITVDAPSGTFQLGDAFNLSNTIQHNQGTFNANIYNLTCTRFASDINNLRTVTMGSGLWTLSGAGNTTNTAPWRIANTGTLTFNKDTADILLSNNTTTSRLFYNAGLSYNKLTIGGDTSTSNTTIWDGNSSFTEIASTKTVAHTVQFNANQGTIGTWSVTGTSGNVVTVDSSTAGFRRTFTLTNVTSGIDYLSVKDIGELSNNKFYVGANSTNGGNNSNVYFTAPPSGAVQSSNFFFLF